jgi:hypothetical protein
VVTAVMHQLWSHFLIHSIIGFEKYFQNITLNPIYAFEKAQLQLVKIKQLCIVFKILVCNSLKAAKNTLAVAVGAILKKT